MGSRFFSAGVLALSLLSRVFAQTVTYQAEDASLTGVIVASASPGFSGTGYVDGIDDGTDQIVFTVNSDTQKLYDLAIIYLGPYGSKYTRISLNGGAGGDVSLPASDTWTTAGAGQVLLNAGKNTIAVQSNWGYYFVDALLVTPSAPREPHQVSGVLVNPGATAGAKALMKFLVANYGTKYISGQQDPVSLAWVETNIGKTPAIIGLDLIEYSPSRVEHGSTSTAVEDAIAFDKRGGIVTFCWHWNSPVGLYDVVGKEWWRGFYTDSTDFNIATAMANPGGANYTLLLRDIDIIAKQLHRLQDAGVPVLWRPLHEAEGGWFWWGAQGSAPCKALWALMYDRLTNYHKLNNLVWIWNSVAADWYPGDATVDVLAYDSYPSTSGDHGPLSATYNALLALGGDKKLIATSEVGTIPDPELTALYGSNWSWFVTWNSFVEDGVANSLSFLQRIYSSAYVLTLDEIQGWKDAPPSTTVSTTPTPTPTPTTSTPTSTPTPTLPPPSSGAGHWDQCGGVDWTGPTTCTGGWTCTPVAPPWYYQCL